jgi:hypothetical protein
MQSGIFPLKEFGPWEAVAMKTYLLLKMFIYEAYSWHLMVIHQKYHHVLYLLLLV